MEKVYSDEEIEGIIDSFDYLNKVKAHYREEKEILEYERKTNLLERERFTQVNEAIVIPKNGGNKPLIPQIIKSLSLFFPEREIHKRLEILEKHSTNSRGIDYFLEDFYKNCEGLKTKKNC